MINNIYELENGRQYNYDKDEINDEDLLLKLVTTKDGGIVFENVESSIVNQVLPVLLSKYQR